MASYSYEEVGKTSFVNPYNFVSINFANKKVKSYQKILEGETHTGVISCSLFTKTPIAIPDAESVTQDKEEHNTYDFMKSPDGRYMIPASSIRGMLRNIFETATDSCFSTMREDTKLNTRSKEFAKPGLLIRENENWKLYEAKKYMLKVIQNDKAGRNNADVWDKQKCPVYTVHKDKNNCRYIECENQKIYSGTLLHFKRLMNGNKEMMYQKKGIDCAPVATEITFRKNDKNALEGYIVIGEHNSSKHHESIFCNQNKIVKVNNINLAMAGMEDTLKVYRNSSINKEYEATHYGYANYETMKKNGCIPVWYIQKGNHFYMQLAAVGRKSFNKTLNSLVGQKSPCSTREKLCEACRLFGMIGREAKAGSIASRVRITDAFCEYKPETEKRTLLELGGPRPSYIPFYANVSVKEFTFTKNNIERVTNAPLEYDDGIKIRGRKYYWHSKNFDEINQNIEKTKRNSTMEVIKEKTEFHFQIYFDRITEEELKKLVWTINFWENDKEGTMCHKIGHGKPIGLGSIKIVIDEIKERTFSPEKGYHINHYDIDYTQVEPMPNSITLQELKKICDFKNCMNVSYPHVELPKDSKMSRKEIEKDNKNALANHKWFTENRNAGKRGHNHKVQVLPRILEKNQELKTYIVKVENRRS